MPSQPEWASVRHLEIHPTVSWLLLSESFSVLLSTSSVHSTTSRPTSRSQQLATLISRGGVRTIQDCPAPGRRMSKSRSLWRLGPSAPGNDSGGHIGVHIRSSRRPAGAESGVDMTKLGGPARRTSCH